MARGLTVEKVVAAAIELADEQGIAAVSMAKVAQRVGFTTMSLYRHVASKDELVQRMLGDGLGMCPEFEIPDWRTGLERWAREMLAAIFRHPWVIDVPISGMLGTVAQLSWLDRGLETLADTPLDENLKSQMVLLVNGYVFWSARLAFQVPDDLEEPMVPQGFDLTNLPSLRRAFEAGVFSDDSPMEELFDYGLQRVLDGIAALIP
jgi:AcrR family transcriptional regulator